MSWLFRKKQSKEAKERTQQKLWLVRESPGQTADLCSCELYEVPDGFYTTCKVLRKEVVLLHTNNLETLKHGGNIEELSLVKVLDLHDNKLTSFPANIGGMTALHTLNLEGNNLKQLPASVGKLSSLESLNAKSNRLVTLPGEIGDLTRLKSLDVTDNPNLTAIPKELCKVRTLESLLLDSHMMSFPPKEIAAGGIEEIMKFMCQVMDIKYIPSSCWVPEQVDRKETTSLVNQMQQDEDAFLASLQKMEELKEKKKHEQLTIEAQVMAEREMENQLVSMAIKKQEESLAQVEEERRRSSKEQADLQVIMSAGKEQLLDAVRESEQSTTNAIARLLDHGLKTSTTVLSSIEDEMQQTEEFVKRQQEDIDQQKQKDIIHAMEEMLAQSREDKFLSEAYEASKHFALRQTQAAEAMDKAHVASVLEKQQKSMNDLIQDIALEEYAQMQAFQGLQLEKDMVYKNITNHIALLQAELTRLSLLEQKRRAADEEMHQAVLEEERQKLAELMMSLLQDQENREKELQMRLVELENRRQEDEKDYWIVQYKRLMLSKPQSLIEEEYECDPAVQDIVKTAGAGHLLPFFSRHKVTIFNLKLMTDEDLRQIGVYQVGVRQNILAGVRSYIGEEQKAAAKAEAIEAGEEGFVLPKMPKAPVGGPSAPSEEEVSQVEAPIVPSAPLLDELPGVPSAPPEPPPAATQLARAEAECVVCLSETPNIILLNCGHVCACEACSVRLDLCPMCRQPVVQKIKLFML